MKTTTLYQTGFTTKATPRYPNAATRREELNKFLDLLMMAALGFGAATILLFLLALI